MKDPLHRLTSFIHKLKTAQLAWHTANQDEIQALKRSRSLAGASLHAELKLQNTALKHDITLLKTRQAAELAMLKTRCAADVQDYSQYLASLEKLKALTKASFAHLPEAIALTIHHHAKSLLNRMWESSDAQEKRKLEGQLIQFMTTVYEEAEQCGQPSTKTALPKNTLKLIEVEAAKASIEE